MKRYLFAAISLLACSRDATTTTQSAATAQPCKGTFSFDTPDVKTLQWIAAGDQQTYLNDLERAYQKNNGRLDSIDQAALAGAIAGLITSANIDAVTTMPPTGITNMNNNKYNNIIKTKEYRGAIHALPMKVTCDEQTGLITAFDYKAPFKSKGFTPTKPIGLRLGLKDYADGESRPGFNYAVQVGGVGVGSVSVVVMVQARLSEPFASINKLLTGANGVPWIQDWVKITAGCRNADGNPYTRVEAQFTKMPTSALWVDDALEQSHGQDGLGDFILNWAGKLAPLHTKYDQTSVVDGWDICAGTEQCPNGYSDSFDVCPMITDDTPEVTAGGGTPCATDLATSASTLGSSFESECFLGPDGDGLALDVACRAGLAWNGSACADPTTGCRDECGDDGGECWLYDDGLYHACGLGEDSCFHLEDCTPGGGGSGGGSGF